MIRAKAIALSAATILAVGGISIALLYANKYNGDQALKKAQSDVQVYEVNSVNAMKITVLLIFPPLLIW